MAAALATGSGTQRSPPGRRRLAPAFVIIALPLALAGLAWHLLSPSDGREPGPDPARLLGTWVYDAALVEQFPPDFRAQARGWQDLRVQFAPGQLAIADGQRRLAGPCQIGSTAPAFYQVNWSPENAPSCTVQFALAGDGLRYMPQPGALTAIPLRRE